MQSKAWKIDVNVPMVMLFAALTGIGLLLTVVAVDAWYKATESEIILFCRERMAHFKAPRTVVFGPLPKTSTGKMQKFVLREQARQLGS